MKKAVASWAAFLLAGCGSAGFPGMASHATGTLQAAAHRGGHALRQGAPQQLFVMPDAGVSPIVGAIQGAKKSIHMEMYLLMPGGVDQQVLDALCNQARAGLDVGVILDGSTSDYPSPPSCQPPANPVRLNQSAYDALAAAGAKVKWSSTSFRFTHQKSMVIDGASAFIMTMNLSTSAFTRNREYVVVDQDTQDVADTERIFSADWNDQTIAPTNPHLVVSPTDSRAGIQALIDSAQHTLVFQVEYCTDRSILAHLQARVKAGVDVTAMMSFQAKDPCSGSDANAQEANAMRQIGVTKFAFPQKLTVHAKAILVDGTTAYIGSENFTNNSLMGNRELGIITTDPNVIQPLARTMAADWASRAMPGMPTMTLGDD